MLDRFFNPKSVAVIGASHHKEKLGFLVYDNIRKYGYKGKLYGVNIKGGSAHISRKKSGAQNMCGIPLYKTVGDIPGPIDLAVVVIPAKAVPQIVKDCGKKGITSVIIISAGFSETGAEGKKLEEKIADLSHKYGIRILGPNCLGIIDSWSKMNASFAESMPDKMKISLLSQSGAICTAILDWANSEEIGFSRFISLGNKLDIDENDVLAYLARDTKTKVVLAYLESIADGQKFMDNARNLALKKPFIMVKSGRTSEGAKSISSHTGSIAGSDIVIDTALRQSGVIRAESLEDLFDLAKIFAFSPEMKGKNVAVISNAGGPAVMLADTIGQSRLKLAKFEPKTRKILEETLPPEAATHNPVDVIGDARADRYETATCEVLKDENVDAAIVVLTPQVMTEIEATAKVINKAKKYGKPLAVSFIGGEKVGDGRKILEDFEIPSYEFPERAIKALEALFEYYEFKRHYGLCHSDCHHVSCKRRNPLKNSQFPITNDQSSSNNQMSNKGGHSGDGRTPESNTDKDSGQVRMTNNRQKVSEIIGPVFNRRQKLITDGSSSAFDVFDAYGISTIKRAYGLGLKDLKKKSEELGFPLVAKTCAEGVLHKTDIGGVKLGMRDESELQKAYFSICNKVRKAGFEEGSDRVDIYKQEEDGVQIFLGAKKDSSFGPLIIFGLGGIFVEALKDFSYRIAPVTHTEAKRMIGEIRSQKVLNGFRGMPEVDRDKVADAIVGLSQLMLDFPEIKEVDINPLMATDKKCVAIDGKIILDLEVDHGF